MGYRDETETLRNRVSELEGDLDDARETIGRLTGLETAPETGSTEEHSALLGAPKLIRLERELDLEVSEEGMEEIANLLRKRAIAGVLGGPTVSQVGRTLTAPGFTLTQKDGMTQISMEGNFKSAPYGALSAGILGGGFTAMAIFGVIHDGFMRGLSEAHFLWMAPIMMLLVFALARGKIGRGVVSNAEKLKGTFEAVVELAKRHRVRDTSRVRVETSEEHELEVDARNDSEDSSHET